MNEESTATHRVVLECCDVRLHGLLHVAGGHKGGGQVDVSVDEVRLQLNRVLVVSQGLFQLASLLVHIAQVRVGLGQQWVLLDGQLTEVGRPRETDTTLQLE